MPPQIAADRQYRTRRAELGYYTPRRYTPRARHRFEVERRRAYLARTVDGATPWQASTIASIIALEWSALAAEAQVGDMLAAREAREHRRLFQRLLSDFERSLAAGTTKSDPMQRFRDAVAARQSGKAA